MAWVAVAIGGSALLGAGTSIYASEQQAGAAEDAANVMGDAYRTAGVTSRSARSDALAYLDPYRAYGLAAGSTLQDMLYSPAQRQQQFADMRLTAQAEVDRLQAQVPQWEHWMDNTYFGENASERKAADFTSIQSSAKQKVAEAQQKLDSINKQASAYDQRVQSGTAGSKPQASAWYQFQADLLNRSQDRKFSALGLSGSGFQAEETRQGLIQLGGIETENQFNRLFQMYNTGANASNVGAGAITGTAQSIANQQIGAGQAAAQGYIGTANANASGVTGIANSVTGAVGAGLNYAMFKNLMDRNAPTPTKTSPGTWSSPVNDAMVG